MMLVFEEDGVRLMCTFGPQVRRSDCEKDRFCHDMASEWDLQSPVKMILFYGNKKLRVANTWSRKKQLKKTHSMSENETQINFALVGAKTRKYLKDMKAIP